MSGIFGGPKRPRGPKEPGQRRFFQRRNKANNSNANQAAIQGLEDQSIAPNDLTGVKRSPDEPQVLDQAQQDQTQDDQAPAKRTRMGPSDQDLQDQQRQELQAQEEKRRIEEKIALEKSEEEKRFAENKAMDDSIAAQNRAAAEQAAQEQQMANEAQANQEAENKKLLEEGAAALAIGAGVVAVSEVESAFADDLKKMEDVAIGGGSDIDSADDKDSRSNLNEGDAGASDYREATDGSNEREEDLEAALTGTGELSSDAASEVIAEQGSPGQTPESGNLNENNAVTEPTEEPVQEPVEAVDLERLNNPRQEPEPEEPTEESRNNADNDARGLEQNNAARSAQEEPVPAAPAPAEAVTAAAPQAEEEKSLSLGDRFKNNFLNNVEKSNLGQAALEIKGAIDSVRGLFKKEELATAPKASTAENATATPASSSPEPSSETTSPAVAATPTVSAAPSAEPLSLGDKLKNNFLNNVEKSNLGQAALEIKGAIDSLRGVKKSAPEASAVESATVTPTPSAETASPAAPAAPSPAAALEQLNNPAPQQASVGQEAADNNANKARESGAASGSSTDPETRTFVAPESPSAKSSAANDGLLATPFSSSPTPGVRAGSKVSSFDKDRDMENTGTGPHR